MSALYFKVYIKPTNDDGLKELRRFLKHVKDGNYEGIAEMDADDDVDAPDHNLSSIKSKFKDGILFLDFNTACSFDPEGLIAFFLKNGAGRVETEIENSQVGEDYYYCNRDYSEDYYSLNWDLLPEPYYFNIFEMRIAILGDPAKKTVKAIKEAEENYEAVVDNSVTEETNLVVSCDGAAASELAKAKKNGVRIITEKHFGDLV